MEKFALIVTEKPEAARRIAQALDYGGTPQKFEDRGVPYFLALRDRKLIVVPALGHLYTVVHQRGWKKLLPCFLF